MVELKYVQKRKRKRRVAIISTASAMGLTVLGIVAFLGRFVGTFTVTMNTGSVELALATKQDFSDQTSFLRVDSLKSFHETTYESIQLDAYKKACYLEGQTEVEDIPVLSEEQAEKANSALDSSSYDYLMGANYGSDGMTVTSMTYFKYTFYVKNVGEKTADYDFSVNILGNAKSTDGSERYLLDTIRVRLFENEGDSHNSQVYAYQTDNPHDDKAFASSEEVVTLDRTCNFVAGEVKRYTIVTWLEGDDPSATGAAPVGATIKLGIQVNAYETEEI